MCMHVCTCTCYSTHVIVKRYLTDVDSLLPHCGFWELNSGQQDWWQMVICFKCLQRTSEPNKHLERLWNFLLLEMCYTFRSVYSFGGYIFSGCFPFFECLVCLVVFRSLSWMLYSPAKTKTETCPALILGNSFLAGYILVNAKCFFGNRKRIIF